MSSCGNTLISGSILFYSKFLINNADFHLFNNDIYWIYNSHKFWQPLIEIFDNENKLDNLADILCFIQLMWQTVPITSKKLNLAHLPFMSLALLDFHHSSIVSNR